MNIMNNDSSERQYNQLLGELAALRKQVTRQQEQIARLQGLQQDSKGMRTTGSVPINRRRLLGGMAAGLLAAGGAFVVNAAPASADATLNGNVVINSTGSLTLPAGTTAQRPTSTATGQLRYNTSLGQLEIYRPVSTWTTLKLGILQGALVHRNTAQTIPFGAPPATVLSFDAVSYDTGGIFSQATPSRLTVPAGVSLVRLTGNIRYADPGVNTNQSSAALFMRRNGQNYTAMPRSGITFPANGAQAISYNVTSPIYTVQAGDYFELYTSHTLTNSSGNPISWDTDTSQSTTWFCMEILG